MPQSTLEHAGDIKKKQAFYVDIEEVVKSKTGTVPVTMARPDTMARRYNGKNGSAVENRVSASAAASQTWTVSRYWGRTWAWPTATLRLPKLRRPLPRCKLRQRITFLSYKSWLFFGCRPRVLLRSFLPRGRHEAIDRFGYRTKKGPSSLR